MEERLGAGILHSDEGCVCVRRCHWRDLVRAIVRRCRPGVVDNMGGAVNLPRLYRAWCGQDWCVGQRRR